MATINASLMFLPMEFQVDLFENGSVQGTLFLDSMVTDVQQVLIYYKLTFTTCICIYIQ